MTMINQQNYTAALRPRLSPHRLLHLPGSSRLTTREFADGFTRTTTHRHCRELEVLPFLAADDSQAVVPPSHYLQVDRYSNIDFYT
jgi:hypothetical protein